MRTTLTLDDDVAAALEQRRRASRHTLKQEVNDLLRAGLAHLEETRPATTFRVEPLRIGKSLVENFDDVSAVLALAEGERYR
jgi:plasmid stability protein